MNASDPYYRADVAFVHDRGFGFHADGCAPGILALLAPVLQRRGLVLELGCGSGHLTRHLVAAGHRVIATDASPAMIALTQANVHGVEDARVLALPDDPLPPADAVISVGHALSYLPTEEDVHRSLVAAAGALSPGGVLALDLCDLQWARERLNAPNYGRSGDDWAIITEFSVPAPDRFVRDMVVFVRNDDDTWRRDREVHDNVLIDTVAVPPLLARHGVDGSLGTAFGDYELPAGLIAVTGRKA